MIKIPSYPLVSVFCIATYCLLAPCAKGQEWVDYQNAAQPLALGVVLKYEAEGTFTMEEDPETGKMVKVPAFESTVDTTNSNGDITKTVTVSAGTVKTLKYDNAAFLRDLASEGALNGDATPSGWALLVIFSGTEDGSYEVVARKANNPESDVSLGTLTAEAFVSTYNFTETTVYGFDSDGFPTTSTVTGSGRFTFEGPYTGDLGGIAISGYALGSGTEFRWYPDITDKSTQNSLLVSGPVKMSSIWGSTTYIDSRTETEYEAYATGTVSLGAGRAVKIQ